MEPLLYEKALPTQKGKKTMANLKTRLFELLGEAQLLSMATVTPDGKPWTRYVMGIADANLTITVITSLKSRKVAHLKANPETHLLAGVGDYGNAEQYAQVQGVTEISTDPELKKQLWNDNLSAYFSGADDPDYAVCLIKPYRIELWSMASMEPEIWQP